MIDLHDRTIDMWLETIEKNPLSIAKTPKVLKENKDFIGKIIEKFPGKQGFGWVVWDIFKSTKVTIVTKQDSILLELASELVMRNPTAFGYMSRTIKRNPQFVKEIVCALLAKENKESIQKAKHFLINQIAPNMQELKHKRFYNRNEKNALIAYQDIYHEMMESVAIASQRPDKTALLDIRFYFRSHNF